MKLDPEQNITPNYWKLIKIHDQKNLLEKPVVKIFSSWVGGYAHGDSWRVSSPIVGAKLEDNVYVVTTESGSTYKILDDAGSYRMTSYSSNVLAGSMQKAKDYAVEPLGFYAAKRELDALK